MLEAVVLFGPPSIGKSETIKTLQRKYKDKQIVMLDKDVLNEQFFKPQIKKSDPNHAFTMLSETVLGMVTLATGKYEPNLDRGNGTVLILQGVTLGGLKRDMEVLFNKGFNFEFILLTTDDARILEKRSARREEENGDNTVGSPKLSYDEAENAIKECNRVFYRMLQAKGKGQGIVTSSLMPVDAKEVDFYKIVRKNPNLVSFSSRVLHTDDPEEDIEGLYGQALEDALTTDIYREKDLEISATAVTMGVGEDTYRAEAV